MTVSVIFIDPNRVLSVHKYWAVDGVTHFFLSENSSDSIEQVLTNLGPTNENVLPNVEPIYFIESSDVVPTIPPFVTHDIGPSQIQTFRERLPIFDYRHNILNAINLNQVVVISGETGLLKTIYLYHQITRNERISFGFKNCPFSSFFVFFG